MGTCLCDAFFPEVAQATVEVLEHVGCSVEFPENQTCCGQPAFNGGDWGASRKVVRHTVKTFSGDLPVVVPSGSCAAMIFHGAPLEFEGEADKGEVDQLAKRTWEISDYLVNGLGIRSWQGSFPYKVAFHRSCHTRGTNSGEASLTLLRSIAGLELLDFVEGEQCCGFGGTFSVTFPNISKGMGLCKLEAIRATKPDFLVSGDMGCLMHLRGLAMKDEWDIPCLHWVQVLNLSLQNKS